MIHKITLLFLEILLFSGFIFSGLFYFKTNQAIWQITYIKLIGTLSILMHLLFATTMPLQKFGDQVIGLLVLLLANIVFYWSLRAARSAKLGFAYDQQRSNAIVVQGPFRYIRHPFYISYMLGWLGGSLATGQLGLILTLLLLAPFYIYAAGDEERKLLTGPLASEYLAYRQRTKKFIPFLY